MLNSVKLSHSSFWSSGQSIINAYNILLQTTKLFNNRKNVFDSNKDPVLTLTYYEVGQKNIENLSYLRFKHCVRLFPVITAGI